jgi:hypothetical protein
VFITGELVATVGCRVAQERFAGVLREGKLPGMSHAAQGKGMAALIRVGPAGGMPGFSELVKAEFLDPVHRGETMTVALRWQAAGRAGGLFPILDADITLAPADGGHTKISLTGTYRAPLGAPAAGPDRLALQRAAEATVTALLSSICDALPGPATAPPRPMPAPVDRPASGLVS